MLPDDAMDTQTTRMKQRLTVSYQEYRDLEKSWLASRSLVSFGCACVRYCCIVLLCVCSIITQAIWHCQHPSHKLS